MTAVVSFLHLLAAVLRKPVCFLWSVCFLHLVQLNFKSWRDINFSAVSLYSLVGFCMKFSFRLVFSLSTDVGFWAKPENLLDPYKCQSQTWESGFVVNQKRCRARHAMCGLPVEGWRSLNRGWHGFSQNREQSSPDLWQAPLILYNFCSKLASQS